MPDCPTPPSDIPVSDALQEIQELLGSNAAQQIKQRFGGIRLFVPKRLAKEHRLIALLGEEKAQQLSRHFGGETLFIPRDARAERRKRNQEIVARYDAGAPVRLLALIYRLTERQIYSILSAPG